MFWSLHIYPVIKKSRNALWRASIVSSDSSATVPFVSDTPKAEAEKTDYVEVSKTTSFLKTRIDLTTLGVFSWEGCGMWSLAGSHLLLLSKCEKYPPDQEMPSFFCQTNPCGGKFIDRGASNRSPKKSIPQSKFFYVSTEACKVWPWQFCSAPKILVRQRMWYFSPLPCSLSDQLFSNSKLSLRDSPFSFTWFISILVVLVLPIIIGPVLVFAIQLLLPYLPKR